LRPYSYTVSESQQTPPELFNKVFWEITLAWMKVEVHRGGKLGERHTPLTKRRATPFKNSL